MKRNELKKDELIGKTIKIINAKNPLLKRLKGKIIDETQNLLILDTGKKIIKNQVVLEINNQMVYGDEIKGRPKVRIKK